MSALVFFDLINKTLSKKPNFKKNERESFIGASGGKVELGGKVALENVFWWVEKGKFHFWGCLGCLDKGFDLFCCFLAFDNS